MARYLSQLIETRGKPEAIFCDNGSEYTGKALFFWSKTDQVRLNFIQPGKPTQNELVESLNDKFRNECLNLRWFRTINEAHHEIGQWQRHCKEEKSHSVLNYLPPAIYAKKEVY